MTDRAAIDVMRAFERMAVGGGACGVARALEPPPIRGDIDEAAWIRMETSTEWVSARRMGRLAFVRHCRTCNKVAAPRNGHRASPAWFRLIVTALTGPEVETLPPWPERCDLCGQCGAVFPGPPMLARARDEPRELLLSLAVPGPVQRIEFRSVLERWMLDEAAVDLVEHRWLMMEQEILDRLTFPAQCAARSCDAQGRQHLEVYEEVVFASRRADGTELWHTLSPGKTWLCQRHGTDLAVATDHRRLRPILQGGPYSW